MPSLGLSTLGHREHSRKVRTFSPQYSAFSLCLDWTTQAGALGGPAPQPCFLDQAPNPPAGQWLGSLPPQPFWDQVEPQSPRGKQENLPPSLSLNLAGVGEDTLLGQNPLSPPLTGNTGPAPPVPASTSSRGAQGVLNEVHQSGPERRIALDRQGPETVPEPGVDEAGSEEHREKLTAEKSRVCPSQFPPHLTPHSGHPHPSGIQTQTRPPLVGQLGEA